MNHINTTFVSMKRLLFIILFISVSTLLFSQVSDFISVKKKNGYIVKTFVAGMPIVFKTKNGELIDGPIKTIRNDSIFITTYYTTNVTTFLGTTVTDTVATYTLGFHYKDIASIQIYERFGFLRGKLDKLLMIGGAGYIALNVINSAISSPSQPINIKDISISAGVFGIGFLIHKLFPDDKFSRKCHEIDYIKVR